MHKVDDAFPASLLGIVPYAGATGSDAAVFRDHRHLGHDQSRATQGTRCVVLEMEVTRHAVCCRVGAHR